MIAAADQFRSQFDRYVDGVTSGRLVVGKLVRLAVERHLRDIEAGRYEFSWERATKALKFISCLKHTTGEYNQEPFSLRSDRPVQNSTGPSAAMRT